MDIRLASEAAHKKSKQTQERSHDLTKRRSRLFSEQARASGEAENKPLKRSKPIQTGAIAMNTPRLPASKLDPERAWP